MAAVIPWSFLADHDSPPANASIDVAQDGVPVSSQDVVSSDRCIISKSWGDEDPHSDNEFSPVVSKARRKKLKSRGHPPGSSHMNLRNRGGVSLPPQ